MDITTWEEIRKFIFGNLTGWLSFLKPVSKRVTNLFKKKKPGNEKAISGVGNIASINDKLNFLSETIFVTEYTQGTRVDRGKLKLSHSGRDYIYGDYTVVYELNDKMETAIEELNVNGFFAYDHLLTLKFQNKRTVSHSGVFMLELPQNYMYGRYLVYYPPFIPTDRRSVIYNDAMPAQDVGEIVFWPVEKEEIANEFISNKAIALTAIQSRAKSIYFGKR